jgi:hypothetical protein
LQNAEENTQLSLPPKKKIQNHSSDRQTPKSEKVMSLVSRTRVKHPRKKDDLVLFE